MLDDPNCYYNSPDGNPYDAPLPAPGTTLFSIAAGREPDNDNLEPFQRSGFLNAEASGDNVPGGGGIYQARVSVLEGRTGRGHLTDEDLSVLSVGAHAQYGWNNSAGVDAALFRIESRNGAIEFGLGVNADTHASIGTNGVSACVLGLGFSVGRKMEIRTPFFSFGLNLF